MEHQQTTRTEPRVSRAPDRASATAGAGVAAHPVLALQGRIGNQAAGRFVQAKLRVGPPGDVYEQEADRVADAVMRMPEGRVMGDPAAGVVRRGGVALRRCACGGTCASCRGEEQEGPLHREEAGAGAGSAFAPPVVHDVLASPGQPLEPGTRMFMESRLGADFGGVRVHADARAAESARAVNAHAYTVGGDIVFAAGRYAPGTREGSRLIAHELVHVAQQRGAAQSPASGVLRRDGASPGSAVAAPARRCGPNVTSQFRRTLGAIERAYRGWRASDRRRACQRILIPVTPGGSPDINGWDTIPLFQGASGWLRSRPVYSPRRRGPCATPTSSDPRNPNPMAPGHEDPLTCSNSVEFDGGCWLNGTANYGTLGVMVRLCAGDFSLGELMTGASAGIARGVAGGVARETGIPELGEVAGALIEGAGSLAGSVTGSQVSLIDWAELLIRGYKLWKGNRTDSPALPVAWVRTFYGAGSSASAPAGANRSTCGTGCRVGAGHVPWTWVWEPVHPR